MRGQEDQKKKGLQVSRSEVGSPEDLPQDSFKSLRLLGRGVSLRPAAELQGGNQGGAATDEAAKATLCVLPEIPAGLFRLQVTENLIKPA